MIEEMEGYRKIVGCGSQGADIEVEQKLQWYLAKEQSEVVECGSRWAVEKRREGRNRAGEQTAPQEQDKKVPFTEEEE